MHIEDIYWEVEGLTSKLREAGKIIASESIEQGLCKNLQGEAVAALKAIFERAEAYEKYLGIQRKIVEEEEDRALDRIQRAAIERINKSIEELNNNNK